MYTFKNCLILIVFEIKNFKLGNKKKQLKESYHFDYKNLQWFVCISVYNINFNIKYLFFLIDIRIFVWKHTRKSKRGLKPRAAHLIV